MTNTLHSVVLVHSGTGLSVLVHQQPCALLSFCMAPLWLASPASVARSFVAQSRFHLKNTVIALVESVPDNHIVVMVIDGFLKQRINQ